MTITGAKRIAGENTVYGKGSHVLYNIGMTAAALLAAAVVAEVLYRLDFGSQNISIVYVLAVFLVSAFTDGYVYGIAATLVGVFAYDYQVSDPRFAFSFTIGFPVTLCIMLLVALATSTITIRIKTAAKVARQKEKRAELLYSINRRMLASRDVGTTARYALEYLVEYYGRSAIFYTQLPSDDSVCHFLEATDDVPLAFFTTPGERGTAALCYESAAPTGCGADFMGGASARYQPVVLHGRVYGVLGISCAAGAIPADDLGFITTISGQAAQALHMQQLAMEQQQAQVEAQTEKMRNSFLRAISHDLRTPLTGILGASSAILETRNAFDPPTLYRLVENIQDDSQRLVRMVENILSITRIHSVGMAVSKSEEAAEEVVAEAVAAFRKHWPKAHVSVVEPGELLLVPMDAILITQVITNILDNALRHSGRPDTRVVIEMQDAEDMAHFFFTDNGPGIDPDILPYLFEMHPERKPAASDSSRGLGIGLSICRAIVAAHGGWITAENLPGNGARFHFALPLGKEGANGE